MLQGIYSKSVCMCVCVGASSSRKSIAKRKLGMVVTGKTFRHVADIGTINEPLRYFAKRHTYSDQSEISPWNLQIILKTRQAKERRKNVIKIKKSVCTNERHIEEIADFTNIQNLCMYIKHLKVNQMS